MRRCFWLLWFMNLFDFLSTWFFVEIVDWAQEVNPIMNWAIQRGFWTFFVAKILPFTLGLFLLKPAEKYPQRVRAVAKVLVGIALVPYSLLTILHLYFWFLYLA